MLPSLANFIKGGKMSLSSFLIVPQILFRSIVVDMERMEGGEIAAYFDERKFEAVDGL